MRSRWARSRHSISPRPAHGSEWRSCHPSASSGASARRTSLSERAPTRLRPASRAQYRARTATPAVASRRTAALGIAPSTTVPSACAALALAGFHVPASVSALSRWRDRVSSPPAGSAGRSRFSTLAARSRLVSSSVDALRKLLIRGPPGHDKSCTCIAWLRTQSVLSSGGGEPA